ncbi:MAG: thioredoxin family protein [Proteobacteria bacterium]|nr:thioredoxin family protein [Pseudomonadota bacterium]
MDDTTEAPLLVACLCAEWCGTCRDYRAVLADAEARFGADAAFGWIDIEDEPDVQGALDIETFPTVLVARGDDVLFYGPLTPQASVLLRTIEKALAGDLAPVRDAALAGLAQRARDVLAA